MERTLVLFHFGGHGLQDNFTFAMCSIIERKKIALPIEQKVRDLSEVQDTYVVALLDYCREKMTIKEVQCIKEKSLLKSMVTEAVRWSKRNKISLLGRQVT